MAIIVNPNSLELGEPQPEPSARLCPSALCYRARGRSQGLRPMSLYTYGSFGQAEPSAPHIVFGSALQSQRRGTGPTATVALSLRVSMVAWYTSPSQVYA